MIRRPAELVLVRHTQSARNVAKKGNAFFLDDESRKSVQGIPDQHVPITDEGRRHAELTGKALRQEFGRFDYVYHSGQPTTIRATRDTNASERNDITAKSSRLARRGSAAAGRWPVRVEATVEV